MKFLEKFMIKDKKLNRLIDIFTIIYLVSLYIFAGGHEHWQQSYSNLIAVFYIYLLGCYAYTHKSELFQDFSLVYLPFLFFAGLSCLWSWDRMYGIKLTAQLFAMFVLAVLMYNYIVSEKKEDLVLYGLYLGGICLMFGTVLYFGIPAYFKGLVSGERMGHILGNLNDEGVHCTYSAIIALYLCIYRKKWLNVIPLICLFVFSAGTGSRKVFVILALGILMLVFLHKGWKYKVFSFAAIVAVILMFMYLPIFKGIMDRIKEALEYRNIGGGDGSTRIRMDMIKVSLAQIKQSPLFGIGLGSSHVLLKRALDFDSYTHSNFIELFLLTGVFGFMFWYTHYLYTVKTFIKKNIEGNGMAVLILTFMVIGLVVQVASVEYQERFTIIIVMYFFAVKEIIGKDTIGRDTVEKRYRKKGKYRKRRE